MATLGRTNGAQTCTPPNNTGGAHAIVGYDESTAPVVAAQHSQMIGLGYWAVSPDWYGTSPGHAFQNTVVGVEASDLAGRSGYPLKLLVMIDGGAIQDGTATFAGCPQNVSDQTACIINNLKADTDYIDLHWAENPYYAKDSSTGANLVSVFISECSWPSIPADCPNQKTHGPTNWDTIWQTVTQYVNSTYAKPMEFVKEFGNFTTDPDPNPFTSSDFSGAYAWPQIAGPTTGGLYYVDSGTGGWNAPAIPPVDPGDCSTSAPGCMQFYWNQTDAPPGNNYQYLGDFYSQAANTPKIAFGELFKGFDWSNAAWSNEIQKVVAQQCGQVLANAALAANTFIESKPLVYAQTPTWNDYEEGTEVETGVDNCWRVQNASYNPTTDTLTWQLNAVAGQQEFATLSTVSGYTVWAAAATGTNPSLQYVVNLLPNANSLSNVSTLIHGHFSQLYVEMVGMPLILNQMSNPANY